MRRLMAAIAGGLLATASAAQTDTGNSDADRLAGVAYGRQIGFALAARERSPNLDRAQDLADLTVPDILPPPSEAMVGDAAGWENSETGARWLRCHQELRAGVAAYLRTALSESELTELWGMLLPRAIVDIPPDGARRLAGPRLIRFTGNGLPLTFQERAIEPFAQRRRDRAWHYLQHHANGRAIMRAITAFLEPRLTGDRSEARLCPRVAAAS